MASKRKRTVAFREDVDIEDKKKKPLEDTEEDITTENQRKSRFKEKHSLDSDEEDDNKEEECQTGLDDEDLAAQEDATITYDGDIKVTPFNLQEEMEEGYFDSHGNYYEKDDPDNIRDNWMDNLDWIKIDEQSELLRDKNLANDEEEQDKPVDKLIVYQQMLGIIQPGETILKALKRLGGTKTLSTSERWKKKKSQDKQVQDINDSKTIEDKASLEYLTGLADQLLATGEYSIYEDTYEKIKFKIQQEEKNREPVDIFSDEPVSSSGQPQPHPLVLDEVTWEYRWEDKEDSDIHGPYNSTQMSEWKENGFFQDGVFVRKCNQKDAPFYNSKRIDFDLYS